MLKNWLEQVDFSKCDNEDKALVINAAMQLYKATNDTFYSDCVVKRADELLAGQTEVVGVTENVLGDYMLGNVMYAAAAITGDEKYVNAAKAIAAGLATQTRNDDKIFVDKSGKLCICDAYCSQVFYMQYETKNGGKERYNDIIDQYKAIYRTVYPEFAKKLSADDEAAAAVAYFAAGLLDTMEVTEQPVYEVFRGMQDIFKGVIADIINHGIFAADRAVDVASLMAAYAVLKGCRMKALHTEKYESIALEVLNRSVEACTANKDSEAKVSYAGDNAESTAAFAICYAESLRQRAYQDYGRGKGGALWS